MGEYAKYKGKEIKIGTCSSMYYLRWEQRNMVTPERGSVNPATQVEDLWFRAPRHREDKVEPGYFEYQGWCGVEPIRFFITNERTRQEVGEIAQREQGHKQLVANDIGVVVNVPCAHGYTVDLPKGMSYNGFAPHVLGVVAVGVRNGKARALIGCTCCGSDFCSMDFEELVRNCKPFGNEAEDWEYVLQTMMDIEASIWIEADREARKQLGMI